MVTEELRKWVKEWVAGWAKNMFFTRADHKMTSSGTSSHGLPVILDNIGKIDASFLDSEDIADVVGTMVTGNTETGIAVTYDDTDNTLDFVLDTEFISDTVGAMVTGNTETGIAVTYQDADNTLDFVVDTEFISDTVGAMVTGNTETGIAVTYDDADNTLDFVLDTEYVQDIVGAMATDSTSIDFSYDDTAGTFTAQRAALTGDVTATANSNATTIANDAVTFAKMQNIATDSLIGRDTASTGDPENITLNATLSMTGAGALQRAALTGDVTASAGSNATTIAADVVDNTKLANMAQATIKGRASGAGTGDPTDLTAAQVATIVNALVDHGTLAGLADDDHTHYMHNSTARTVSARHTMTDGAVFQRASYPVILVERSGSAAGLQASFGLKYTKSSASVDGDGPRFVFELNDDSTTTQNIVAGIGAARDGADNSADVVIQAATAGSVAEVARFHKEGGATITGVLTATGINVGEDTLSYFDEGTWTPALAFGGSSSGVTYTTRTGTYTRIGSTVWLFAEIQLSSKGSATGAATITGFPFTTSSQRFSCDVASSSMTGTYVQTQAYTTGTATSCQLVGRTAAATGFSNLTDAGFSNTSILYFTLTYQV